MRLMIVGGGQGQLNAIRQAKRMGYETVVSDRDPKAPGLSLAGHGVRADTFDVRETLQAAQKYAVDGIATLGTDQPVLTVTRVAEQLGLPHSLSDEQALIMTNKRYMKPMFKGCAIPHTPYRIVDASFRTAELEGLEPPFVVKPVDSQGQRGVLRLSSAAEVAEYLPQSLAFSRDGYAVVEEYYESDEITFTAWVRSGELFPLSITDRRTRSNFPHIGVCYAHTYPSRHFERYGEEILEISRRITECVGITQGPLYFQMLIGRDGIKVNEIAARIGGAYEDEFIPALTGVDINRLNFAEALGKEASMETLRRFKYPAEGAMAVLLVFTEPLSVAGIGSRDELLEVPEVLQARYLLGSGSEVGPMHNSTGRAAYVIIKGDTAAQVNGGIRRVYDRLFLSGGDGSNRIIDFSEESFLE